MTEAELYLTALGPGTFECDKGKISIRNSLSNMWRIDSWIDVIYTRESLSVGARWCSKEHRWITIGRFPNAGTPSKKVQDHLVSRMKEAISRL